MPASRRGGHRHRRARTRRRGAAGPRGAPGAHLRLLHLGRAGPARLAAGVRGQDRGAGKHGHLLGHHLCRVRGRGHRGVLSQRAPRQRRAGPQDRRLRRAMAPATAHRGAAQKILPSAQGHRAPALLDAPPGGAHRRGGAPVTARAKGPDGNEPAHPPCLQRPGWRERPAHRRSHPRRRARRGEAGRPARQPLPHARGQSPRRPPGRLPRRISLCLKPMPGTPRANRRSHRRLRRGDRAAQRQSLRRRQRPRARRARRRAPRAARTRTARPPPSAKKPGVTTAWTYRPSTASARARSAC